MSIQNRYIHTCNATYSDALKFAISKYILYIKRDNNYVLFKVEIDNNKYESIVHLSDLKTPFCNDSTYQFILNCLQNELNYLFATAFIDDTYFIRFHTLLGYYEVSVVIKLKKVSDLNQQIDDLNENIKYIKELEDKNEYYQEELQKLKDIINTFNVIDIRFSRELNGKNYPNVYIPITSKEVLLINTTDYHKIKALYCLEKLSIVTVSDKLCFENNSVKELILTASEIQTLEGIDKFPNLEYLELVKCDKLYDIKSYINNTNIKKIVFRKCGDNLKRNISLYCNAKNIELEFIN